uniref:Uncharacterized protein n=1 Tax=Physcomitrium patens TaxID=3218 RepID=A0A2K1L903_PHYPA|nr:hypothetical protein PHYPA_000942 [Physcomitrium patens]
MASSGRSLERPSRWASSSSKLVRTHSSGSEINDDPVKLIRHLTYGRMRRCLRRR